MEYFLGIDLGTQSVKVVCYDEEGNFVALASREYSILTPTPGYAEQHPETWWEKTREAIQEVLATLPEPTIRALSFSGQMHGTVMLDESLVPLYPAIIWADQRSHQEAREIREKVGEYLKLAGSDVATGFMAATLLWVRRNLPDVYRRVRFVLLPKDFLKVKLGLPPTTDVADASSTLLFNIRLRNWSEEILAALGLDRAIFPPVHESTQVIGQVARNVREELGMKGPCLVVAGAGDQHCAALGNGVTDEGELLVTIGTGGQVFTPITQPLVDAKLRIHTFCHAVPGFWHLLGATLCAGLSLSWFKKSILDSGTHVFDFRNLDQEAQKVDAGCNGLLFFPYLIGERTPYMDPHARGAFVNLHLTHQRGHFVRAIMEGVGFGLRNAVEVFRELGVDFQRTVFSGGGARSNLWRRIVASILDMPLFTTQVREEAATGACILAMVGSGRFGSVDEATRVLVQYTHPTLPDPAWVEVYHRLYQKFQKGYTALRELSPGS